jgi:hypothetical protein
VRSLCELGISYASDGTESATIFSNCWTPGRAFFKSEGRRRYSATPSGLLASRRVTARSGELAGVFEYPAVYAAIARFEKRLKIDRALQKKIKKAVKELNIEI